MSSLHFTPPSGWMNDPNGLIHFEGEWHLFYQYLPPGSQAKHWGHAVSPDLLNWEHLPVALEPDALGQIWSGSCVADVHDTSGFFHGGSGLVAIFTHHLDGQALPQSQSIAYSSDKGRTWTKYSGNPVLRSLDNPNFRDPKVFWHPQTKSWVMILAAGDHVEIYRSHDLKEWNFASSFGHGLSPLVWECPDLFQLHDEDGNPVWILTASFLSHENFSGKAAPCEMHYIAGEFDGLTFMHETEMRRLSRGPDDYAAVTFADAPDGRRILLGWLNHWGYSFHSGQMTLPRELSWRDGELVQTPATGVPCSDLTDGLATGRAPWKITPPGIASWKLEARIDGALVFSLSRDAQKERWTLQRGPASFPPDWLGKKVNLESIFAAPHEAPISARASESTLVVVDSNSVEVFCDGGRSYFAAQIFPPDGEWKIDFLEI